MSITLYTAPDCIRCNIVKGFLKEKNMPYETVDFKEQKTEFNTFYRAKRPQIYRNPEGVEFPLFFDGETVKQGSGEIIAYLLSGHVLEGSVTRSDLLHGWISGLYPSLCPPEQDANYLELVRHLAAGGLKIYLQTDGRRPDLLEKLLKSGNITKVSLTLLGSASLYEEAFGGPITKEELAKSVALVEAFSKGDVRLLVSPVKRQDGSYSWLTKEEAAEAAKFMAEAVGKPSQAISIAAVTELMPQGLQGLEPFDQFLPYRSAVRNHLFKAEIAKD